MGRERSFLQRGKRVQLQELTNLVAVRSPGPTRSRGVAAVAEEAATSAQESRLERGRLEVLTPGVPSSQLRAFENAGWTFVPRSSSGDFPGESLQAKVFVKSGGRLALGTDTLVVKFREDLSEEAAQERLAPFGCRVLEKLTFAPGLFRAEVVERSDRDALDIAEELAQAEACEFAEPELIEPTGHR